LMIEYDKIRGWVGESEKTPILSYPFTLTIILNLLLVY
jgi:hypothetical protein